MIKDKKIIIFSLIVLLGVFLGFALGFFVNQSIKEKSTQEATQIDSSTGEVKTFRKPSLVFFYGKDCSSCENAKPNWTYIKKKYGKNFILHEVDVGKYENTRLAYEFMVNVIPAIYIEDVEFKHRVFINPAEYYYLPRFKSTLDRYLSVRKILIKGALAK